MVILPHIIIHYNHITFLQIINGGFAYFHKSKLMFTGMPRLAIRDWESGNYLRLQPDTKHD